MNFVKKHFIISLISITFINSLISCDLIADLGANQSHITFKATAISENDTSNDTIVFTSKEIIWLNETTNEILFKDSFIFDTIIKYRSIICYLDSDSFFSFKPTSNYMSSVWNDLVLNQNLYDGKYYFEDGYPGWIDNLGATTERVQNKIKRAEAWSRFINQLKLERKIK